MKIQNIEMHFDKFYMFRRKMFIGMFISRNLLSNENSKRIETYFIENKKRKMARRDISKISRNHAFTFHLIKFEILVPSSEKRSGICKIKIKIQSRSSTRRFFFFFFVS